MSVEGDLFRVTVKGSRESVVRMMNAALKRFNSDKVIVKSDDIDTMNSKLESFTGKEGKDLGIPDLLGPGNDTDVHRFLELVRIEDDAPGLMAKFSYYLSENALYYEDDDDDNESVGWDTVALQYNCQVFLDDDWYINGQFLRFGEATIYDASAGEIRKIYLNSGSKYDAEEYPFFLKTLAHLYPDHYGADWDHYHNDHPEVEISEDECLAWFNEQKQPWQQEESETEEFEDDPFPANDPQYPIDENGHADIPEGTTYIDDLAFKECPGLVSVNIPDSVNWIGPGAFYGCTNLTSIKASGVRVIDNVAFFGCTKLTSVVVPEGVSIADNAFEGCPCEEEIKEKYCK